MKYKNLKRLINMFANNENVLEYDFVDFNRFIMELMELRKVCESNTSVYFSSVADKDKKVVRKKDNKTFHFKANILITNTDLLNKIKAKQVKEYSGRAKTLYKAPKMLYEGCYNYWKEWIHRKGGFIMKFINQEQIEKTNDDLTIAKKELAIQTNPVELEKSLEIFVKQTELFKELKNELTELNKEPKQIIKIFKDNLETLENQIKEFVKDNYKESYYQYVNEETGEVKTKIQNNLGTGIFTYTPAKEEKIVDKPTLIEKLKADRNFEPQLLKIEQVFSIDKEELDKYILKNGINKLPTKTIKSPVKVGIQKTSILNKIRKNTLDGKKIKGGL